MGSQTLEILRQGVLASLTGGWYYDVHQNVFCNAVHLYIWLFLLFLPFIIYMYFPTTLIVWSVYCVLVAIIITFFKMVNVALHRMYDRARTMSETNLKKPGVGGGTKMPGAGGPNSGPGGGGGGEDDEAGIEMQILGTVEVVGTPPVNASSRTSVEHPSDENHSYANSALSFDFPEQVTSTIDLKVDVHRKNSSESSDSGMSGGATGTGADGAACVEASGHARARCSTVQTHSAEVCSTATHKRSLSTPNQDRFSEMALENAVREMSGEFGTAGGSSSAGGSTSIVAIDGGLAKDRQQRQLQQQQPLAGRSMMSAQSNASLRRHQYKSRRKQRFMNSQLQRQISLDSEKLAMGSGSSVFGAEEERGAGVTDGARNRRKQGFGFGRSTSGSGVSGGVAAGERQSASRGASGGDGVKLQRHLSSDDQSNKSIGSLFQHHQHYQLHHHHHHHHHHHLLAMQNHDPADLYHLDHSYTKSAVQLAIESSAGDAIGGKGTMGGGGGGGSYLLHQATPIRRDSSSTMSALQLPTIASGSSSAVVGAGSSSGAANGPSAGGRSGSGSGGSKRRRHSNTNPTGNNGGTGRPLPRSLTSVRRIKSAALETCSPASISNLTPTHPNSVEVIGGQTLRNPRHTVLPPPSKCLSRNPYLNLFTKSNEGSSGSGLVDVCRGTASSLTMVMGSGDPVYPIAEQSDESTPIKSGGDGVRLVTSDEKTVIQRCVLHSDSDDELQDEDDEEDEEESDDEEVDEEHVQVAEDDVDAVVDQCSGRVRGGQDGPKLVERVADSEEDLTLHDQLRRLHHQQRDRMELLDHQLETADRPPAVPAGDGGDDRSDEAIDSDLDPPDSGLQSTDSDTENNAGSRSPLLEPRTHRAGSEQAVVIVEAKNTACLAASGGDVKKTSSSPTISDTLRSPVKPFGDELGCLSSSDWEHASASSKDLLIAKDSPPKAAPSVAGEHGDPSATQRTTGSSGKMADGTTALDTTATTSGITSAQRNLGAIPKTSPQGRFSTRRLSIEDNYPSTSGKIYNRTLSQRLSAERIPENAATAPLITFLNYRSDVPIPPIYLPGNSALSEQQTNGSFSFRSRGIPFPSRSYRQLNCRLRILKSADEGGTDSGETGAGATAAAACETTSGAVGVNDYWRDDDNNNCNYCLDALEGGQQQAGVTAGRLQSEAAGSHPGVSGTRGGGGGIGGGGELMPGSVGEVPWNFYVADDSDRWLRCAANAIKERIGALNHHLHAHHHLHHMHHHHHPRSSAISISGPSGIGGIGVAGGSASVLSGSGGVGGATTIGTISSTGDDFNTASINSAGGVGGAGGGSAGGREVGTIDKAIVASTECSLSRAQSTIDVVLHSMFGDGGQTVRPKRYYRFPLNFLCFREHLNISMNRLQLLALFDRDTSWAQVVLAIGLCTLVSLLGSLVLYLKFYEDLYAFIFCFVIAGSQYSLLKSVQPDAASPIHGFNKTVTYSRPIYFCLCCALLLGVHRVLRDYELELSQGGTPLGQGLLGSHVLFGFRISIVAFLQSSQSILSVVILSFPFLFSLGLFPQINTFTMYALEQLDMHLFGSNASCSLLASFLSVLRSVLACTLLFGPAFGALSETGTQHVLFSMFCAFLVTVSYHLSRCASDYTYVWAVIKSLLLAHPDDDDASSGARDDSKRSVSSGSCDDSKGAEGDLPTVVAGARAAERRQSVPARSTDEMNRDFDEEAAREDTKELDDPLPRKLQDTVTARMKNDGVVCVVLAVAMFSLHCSTVFTVLQPEINHVLHSGACIVGFLVHYVVPQLRKHLPWLCIAKPILKPDEFGLFEVQKLSKIMWFETMYVLLCFFERNILYPLIFVSALTADSGLIVQKFGLTLGTMLIVVCSLKCVRNSYSDVGSQYIILIFTVLFFRLDYKLSSETFLLDYFLISILYRKISEFLLKLQFVVTYIAPWQITWGSAFHAFAQPFSVPHSAMLFLQTAISAILSTPLNPFLGSAIFLTSYVRPIKFWERDYNTRRIDHSNTRLSSQLERDLGADDNNLNSIFYEHLTRSLQHSLCGDLLMGRWGNVSQGDCFVLASDYLNCLVHIIELGNGLCTFQMRGLEFRGTYCQQREVEAISEEVEDNIGCCCCTIGHLPRMLSANAMFTTRWLAWQVMASKYVLEGYSISDNSATATLQVFEFRKVLISYYVKSIIYYTLRSPKLMSWLQSQAIEEALEHTTDRQFVDLDPVFNHNLDDDYDFRTAGITRASFWCIYGEWIQFCSTKKRQQLQAALNERNSTPKKTPPASTGSTTGTAGSVVNCVVSSTTQTHGANAASTDATKDAKASPGTSVTTGSTAEIDGTTTGAGPGSAGNSKGESSGTHNNNGAHAAATSSNCGGADGTNAGSGSNGSSSNGTSNFFSSNRDSLVTSLCMSLALLARRTLATASHSSSCGVEFFLHGLHALFKGDFRITCPRDEWVFADMELLHGVVAPAVRMSLKLHQDHFLCPDEYDDYSFLYNAIDFHTKELVISHEADPLWRNAVLRGTPNLLALRHVMDDGSDEYRVIRLSKRYLNFRVIKLNRECVRGLWAGQQQELIYLRNRNPERGSIQNAKQALRNIINSSCDQPIGYPIYVSPLTTSYAETNAQLCRIIGGEITPEKIQQMLIRCWKRIRQRCREGCSSGSAIVDGEMTEMQGVYCNTPTPNNTLSGTAGTLSYGSQNMSISGAVAPRGSMASINKPTSSTLLAGFLNRERDAEREAMAVVGVRERSTIAKRNVSSTSKDRIDWGTLQISKRDSYREAVLAEAVAAAAVAGGSGNDSSAGADDECTGGACASPSSTLKASAESASGLISHKQHPLMLSAVGTGIALPPGVASGSGGGLAAVGSRIPGVPGTLTFTLSPPDDASYSLFSMATAAESTEAQAAAANLQWIQTPPVIGLNKKVIIVDASQIYDCLDLGRRIDVTWPNEQFRASGGRASWKEWIPQEGMVGHVVHYWQPNHPDHHFRSNVNRTILLVKIGERHVPIGEKGIKEYNTIGLTAIGAISSTVEDNPAAACGADSSCRSVSINMIPMERTGSRELIVTSTTSGALVEVESSDTIATPEKSTPSKVLEGDAAGDPASCFAACTDEHDQSQSCPRCSGLV
ncbi:protein pecanex [Anopheles cruzii]|uniref:protein pecanex n=1 Tax=Anopheles cruzii TaxID=68878 RepID=UPI0022EC7564|nr:protein pecanex [Anopheles cruzii]